MNKYEAEAAPTFDLAITVAQDIFRTLSGPKALISETGHPVALSAGCDAAFLKALGLLSTGAPAPASIKLSDFAADSPLAQYRLAEPTFAPRQLDPSLMHDLRDMLHALSLTVAASSAQGAANPMARQVELIATQISGLLKSETAPERLDLTARLKGICELLRPRFAEESAELILELPARPVWVRIDQQALTRLVQNLLINAAQQSRNGEVTLRLIAPRDGSELRLEVTDEGPGLPPELADWVTGRSRDSEAPATRKGHGHGLTIIRRAVEHLGGRLELSRAPHHLVKLHLPPALLESGSAPVQQLKGRRIWVVDNNPLAADLLKSALTGAGAEVQAFTGRAELRSAAAEGWPELLLSDYHLSGETGAELCREARSMGFKGALALLTGDETAETRARALAAGCSDIWYKPLSAAELSARIAPLLSTAPAGAEVPVFDPEIALELFEDNGVAATLQFMRRAVSEAGAISPLTDHEDPAPLRAALHSAVGATAITGLAKINHLLRTLHAEVANGSASSSAFERLADGIRTTAMILDKIDPKNAKTVSNV